MSKSTAAKKANNTSKNGSIAILSSLYTGLEKDISPLQMEFSHLLQEKTFFYNGGILAFGLTYKYTFSELDSYLHNGGIAGLKTSLTAADKALYAMGEMLNLNPKLKIVYEMIDYPGTSIMSTTLSPFPNPAYPYPPTWENTGGFSDLCRQIGGDLIKLSDDRISNQPILKVDWVAPVKHINIRPIFIMRSGGEGAFSHICGSYILTMSVPAWSRRMEAKAKGITKV